MYMYITKHLNVEPKILNPALPDIRPDIRYPAFKLAGYPAGRISSQISIRCIPMHVTLDEYHLGVLCALLWLVKHNFFS
jgi:hypothetical protein